MELNASNFSMSLWCGVGAKFSLKIILVKFATPILSGIFVISLGYGEEKACCFV